MLAKRSNPWTDAAFYFGIPLWIVASLFLVIAYGERVGLDPSDAGKVVGVELGTLVVFGVMLRLNWDLRCERGFWLRIGVLLVAHIGLMAMYWRVGDEYGKFILGLIIVAESFLGRMLVQGLRKSE